MEVVPREGGPQCQLRVPAGVIDMIISNLI